MPKSKEAPTDLLQTELDTCWGNVSGPMKLYRDVASEQVEMEIEIPEI